MNFLNIAVISDLHVFQQPPPPQPGDKMFEEPSTLHVALPEDQPTRHPIVGLQKLISDEKLSAHLLLCPGDIGDKAVPAALMRGWQWIHQVGKDLEVDLVAATTGNHDCDSRHKYNHYDAKGILQSLVPPYPLKNEAENDKYWSRNFTIVDTDGRFRLLVLNSSAYHGFEDEYQHGRVADSTLNYIKAQLKPLPKKRANILLCHHHPLPHMDLSLDEKDLMKNGPLLIDAIGSGEFGSWLIVHGHKHHPKLTYAQGSGAAPIVFSAASLCARMQGEVINSPARNQFHIISLHTDQFETLGLVGTVKSWEWHSSHGWMKSPRTSQLPHKCGFGCKDTFQLAQRVQKLITTDRVSWAEISEKEPMVEYLVPLDMNLLVKELQGSQLVFSFDEYGYPIEVGRVS